MRTLPMLQTTSITCRDEEDCGMVMMAEPSNALAVMLARLARARLGSLLETPA